MASAQAHAPAWPSQYAFQCWRVSEKAFLIKLRASAEFNKTLNRCASVAVHGSVFCEIKQRNKKRCLNIFTEIADSSRNHRTTTVDRND